MSRATKPETFPRARSQKEREGDSLLLFVGGERRVDAAASFDCSPAIGEIFREKDEKWPDAPKRPKRPETRTLSGLVRCTSQKSSSSFPTAPHLLFTQNSFYYHQLPRALPPPPGQICIHCPFPLRRWLERGYGGWMGEGGRGGSRRRWHN